MKKKKKKDRIFSVPTSSLSQSSISQFLDSSSHIKDANQFSQPSRHNNTHFLSSFPSSSSSVEEYKDLFIKLLKKIFQFDKYDLDFGIYRLLNLKNYEIRNFLEKDLNKLIEKEIKQSFAHIKDNIDYEKIYRNIFSSLIDFFSLYYDNGDFISKRRYTESYDYFIPYNGSEVYFYWANYNQYYVKSTENFSYYSFKVGKWTISFELSRSEIELEKINNKSQERKYFIFSYLTNQEKYKISIFFSYRTLTEEEFIELSEMTVKKKKNISQDFINKYNILKIYSLINKRIQIELDKKHSKLDGTLSNKTELEWHLTKFTTKNSSDYFIHKDLKNFFLKELDFYIKNRLLDFNSNNEPDLIVSRLCEINIFRNISSTIISFLAEIEDFQKLLWEKKKFILSTNYIITIDHINEKFYPEILKNQKQIEDWLKLNLVQKKNSLNISFLKNNPSLTIDTKFFDDDFKFRILQNLTQLEENITGILFKSDNFQALSLLKEKYKNKISMFYIDPPYNTGNDGFPYKDRLKHSSWLSLLDQTISFMPFLGNKNSTFFISIDNNEYTNLNKLVEQKFGEENLYGPIIVQVNRGGRDYLPIAISHEYIICGSLHNNPNTFREIHNPEKEKKMIYSDLKGKFQIRELRNRNPKFNKKNRPNLYYPFYININYNHENGFAPVSLTKTELHKHKVFPVNSNGDEDCWRWGKKLVQENLNIFDPDKSNIVAKQKKDGNWNIYEKYRSVTAKAKSIWDETNVRTENGSISLKNLFGKRSFDFPKPVELVEKCIEIGSDKDGFIMDFFAGTGTTAEAVLRLNKKDNGKRKFILVEMGNYFNSILIPRIKKIIFSQNWKDNIPKDKNGISKQIIKYHTLEQYEDTLQNIEFKSVKKTLKKSLGLQEHFSRNYLIKDMLNFESKNNNVFLNLKTLENPFSYSLKIFGDNGYKGENVDLVETFNYIAGIFVEEIYYFKPSKENNNNKYIVIIGIINDNKLFNSAIFKDKNKKIKNFAFNKKIVDETSKTTNHLKEENKNRFGDRKNNKVLVIWRNTTDLFNPEIDRDFIEKYIINNCEFDRIYVNGSCLVKNIESLSVLFKKKI